MKSANYSWVKGDLFFTGPNLIIRMCVMEDEMYDILRACHDEPCGGNFLDKRITYKILLSSYYFSSIFKDEKDYIRNCDNYQTIR